VLDFRIRVELFLGYGPMYVVILLALILFILTMKKMRKHQQKSDVSVSFIASTEEQQEIIKTYQAFLIVLFICWLIPLINRIYNGIHGHPLFSLMLLHGIFQPLQGFFNTVVYLYPTFKKLCTNTTIKYQKINDDKYGNFLHYYDSRGSDLLE